MAGENGQVLRKVDTVFELKIAHTDLFDAGDTEIYTFNEANKISYVDVFYKDTAAVAALHERAGR